MPRPELFLRMGSHAEKQYVLKTLKLFQGILVGANLLGLSAGIGETRVFIEFPGLGCWSSFRLGGLESESPALFTGFPHCLRLIAAAIPRVSRSLRPGASPDASR